MYNPLWTLCLGIAYLSGEFRQAFSHFCSNYVTSELCLGHFYIKTDHEIRQKVQNLVQNNIYGHRGLWTQRSMDTGSCPKCEFNTDQLPVDGCLGAFNIRE